MVLKILAVTDNISVLRNITQLFDGDSRDFFLRLEGNSLTLNSARDVYYKDSFAYGLWTDPNTTGTRLFALSVNDPETGIGSLYELDHTKTRESILKYGTLRGMTDEELDTRIRATVFESRWNAMDPAEREHEKRAIRGHAEDEINRLDRHLTQQRELYPETGREVSLLSFLAVLNREFMDRSEHAQPDMLRIPHETAKELMAGGVPVYHLTPHGPRQMSTIEAIHSKVWNHRDSAVAILPVDLDALDKWAARVAGDILRSQEREEPKKDRNTER
jgi:hypothetical protein